jgi:hypothetical protein
MSESESLPGTRDLLLLLGLAAAMLGFCAIAEGLRTPVAASSIVATAPRIQQSIEERAALSRATPTRDLGRQHGRPMIHPIEVPVRPTSHPWTHRFFPPEQSRHVDTKAMERVLRDVYDPRRTLQSTASLTRRFPNLEHSANPALRD